MAPLANNIRRGQAKPYDSVPRIDWTHPLTKGLVSYGYDDGNGPSELVVYHGSTINDAAQTVGRSTSKFGKSLLYLGASFANHPCQRTLPTNPAFASITNGGVYSFAAAVMLTAATSGGSAQLYGSGDATVNTPFAILSAAGSNGFLVEFANGTQVVTGVGTNTLNIFHTIVGVASPSGTAKAYLDGVLKNTSSITTALTQAGVQPQFSGFSSASNSQTWQDGYIFYGAAWNRRLTDYEANLLHIDPYCFLIYPEDELLATQVGTVAAIPVGFGFSDFQQIFAGAALDKKNRISPRNFQEFIPRPALPPTFFSTFDPPAPPASSPSKNRVQPRQFQDFINAPGNPNQFFGNTFSWWPQAQRPVNRAVMDWTEFRVKNIVGPPGPLSQFSQFDPPAKPPHLAKDWIEFRDLNIVGPPAIWFPFTDFVPPPKPLNFAFRDFQYFINAPGNPNQFFGNDFSWWPGSGKPPNYARDWIEYSEFGYTTVVTAVTFGGFTQFDPAAPTRNLDVARRNFQDFINAPGNPNQFFGEGHDWWPRAPAPINFAKDWITQFGNISVDTLPIESFSFSPFDPAPRPHNYSRDWIEYNEIGYTITTLSQTGIGFFTPFEPPAKPKNFALDWIVFSGNVTVESPVAVSFGGFSPFDPAPRPRNFDITRFDFQEFINAPGNPNQFFGNSHDWWPSAFKLRNYAKDWIEFYQQTIVGPPSVLFPFTPFEPPAKPRNFAKDWIEFYQQTIVGPPSTWFPFTDFSLGAKPPNVARNFQEFINAPGNPNQFFGNGHDWWPRAPAPRNFALDWVAFSGNIFVEAPTPIVFSGFATFDPAPKPRNLDVTRRDLQTFINAPGNPNQFFGEGHDWWPRAAKPPYYAIDWITQFGNISVDTLPIDPIPFTKFDPAPRPHNFAVDWTAYHPSNQFFTPTPTTSTMFSPFADGVRWKLWTRFGQQPQWWTYSFISPPSPPKPKTKRDTHDWIRKRHPSVYSQEYYDSLLKLKEVLEELEPEELAEIVARQPNLLIPLEDLIPAIDIATLKIDMPSLRIPPPVWTPEDVDEVIEEILEAEIELEQHEVDLQKLVYESILQKPATPAPAPTPVSSRQAQNIVLQFSDAIDKYHKAATGKKRVIYDSDGRVISIEPDEEDDH